MDSSGGLIHHVEYKWQKSVAGNQEWYLLAPTLTADGCKRAPLSGPRGTRAGCTGVKHWREPKKVQQMGEV
jgi:hypothetical protein